MLSAVSGSLTHHAIYVTARGSIFLVYGEDGDKELHQAMGTKVKRCPNLQKPCILTLGCLTAPAFGVIT